MKLNKEKALVKLKQLTSKELIWLLEHIETLLERQQATQQQPSASQVLSNFFNGTFEKHHPGGCMFED